MRPLLVLVVLPMLIGFASERIFHDARRASLCAALTTLVAVALFVAGSALVLGAGARWTWLAAILVSPLPIAFAVATVLFWYGHLESKRRGDRRRLRGDGA